MRALVAGAILGAIITAGGVQAKPEVKLEKTFKKGGHIHGYLIDPAGHGFYGIVILTTMDGKRISYHETQRLRRGRFDIDNIEPGRYKLHVPTLGPLVTDLQPPADVEVEVKAGKVTRPRLVAK